MESVRTRPLRQLGGAILALTLAATAGLLITGRAARAEPTPTIVVNLFQKERLVTSPADTGIDVEIAEPPLDHDVLIAGEFEGGPNDPEQSDETPVSYGRPDTFCIIEAGSFGCQLPIRIFWPSAGDTVRVFVSAAGSMIDTRESPTPMLVLAIPTSNSPILGGYGCQFEPDSTEVVQFTAIGTHGDPSPPPAPPPGTNPDPYTCDDPAPEPSGSSSPSPSGSPTPTDTGSPTPTPTDTGSPTPTPTDTGFPTPTPSPTPTPTVLTAPYDGRFRANSCATYFPITQTAPCTATGDADAATGAATATATIESIEGEAITLAGAGATGGIVQSLPYSGSRIVVRFRIDRGSIRAQRNGGTLAAPSGSISVVVNADSECGSSSASQVVPINGSGDVEGAIIEVSLQTDYCDTAVSIRAGVQADANVTPISSGSIAVDAAATVLRVTVS